ncbi:hypothetical protein NTE_00997 [Candidatus Nitrososphaera evergladensis SR1]|jgi:YVTN family beta-propeller protein|uniref:YVTN family beta-propeller repeat protein n=1 Tax=Candidatus Nitrososphaera evergladensis SR1 TaxID=1459636 RepID=A0A075MNE2_9ARCH|nr:YncE family protein [Candidatus Nitrososphaera evergladensis]AIF83071.1 hypothetical protein NTE_00997 [Candidatus Nitrososphaera evergladensis SR1]
MSKAALELAVSAAALILLSTSAVLHPPSFPYGRVVAFADDSEDDKIEHSKDEKTNFSSPTFDSSQVVKSTLLDNDKMKYEEVANADGNFPFLVPVGMAYDSETREMYVASSATHSVVVMDATTDTAIDVIPIAERNDTFSFAGPLGLAYDPAMGYIFAANAPYGKVSVISDSDHKIVGEIKISGELGRLAVDTDHNKVYVVNSGTISVVDDETLEVIDNIKLRDGTFMTDIVYDPDDEKMYVAMFGGSYAGAGIAVIDTNTHDVIATVSTYDNVPSNIALDSHYPRVYVTSLSGEVFVISTDNYKITDTIRIPDTPYGYRHDPSTQKVVVYGNFTERIEQMTGKEELLSSSPTAIVFNPDNNYLYVVHYGVGVLSVIDTESLTVIDNISTLPGSHDIAYDPDNHSIYQTHESMNSISILSIEP